MTYLTFEGGEGSGKSTQARLLAKRLSTKVVATREPGATELGLRLRELLLNTDQVEIDARSEALLMAADRAQHMVEVIQPALADSKIVVSDRSVYSSMAYQGAARGLGLDAVRELNDWALHGRWPDIVVLLDLDREAASSRLNRGLDRLEREGDSFHENVFSAYREMAKDDPERWVVVSAVGTLSDVADRVWAAVSDRLDLP